MRRETHCVLSYTYIMPVRTRGGSGGAGRTRRIARRRRLDPAKLLAMGVQRPTLPRRLALVRAESWPPEAA